MTNLPLYPLPPRADRRLSPRPSPFGFMPYTAAGLPTVNIGLGYHEPRSPAGRVSLPRLRPAMGWVSVVLEAPA